MYFAFENSFKKVIPIYLSIYLRIYKRRRQIILNRVVSNFSKLILPNSKTNLEKKNLDNIYACEFWELLFWDAE